VSRECVSVRTTRSPTSSKPKGFIVASNEKVGKLPKASSITKDHMVSAYVYGSSRQQKRIEAFGRLNKKILQGIGKPAKHDGTVSRPKK
jgi:hypothetical protein